MSENQQHGELPMRGHASVPDGLLAYAQPTHPDGSFDHDRAGRPKVRRVRLRADRLHPPHRPEGLLSDAEWTWSTSAPRRWTTIVAKLGDRAEKIALALATTCCVDLEHDYRAGAIVHPPRRWIPHPSLAHDHATNKSTQRAQQRELRQRAAELRDELAAEYPGVASALTPSTTSNRLTWLLRAAEDLAAGKTHDGARAFVQAHVGDTKAREDLPRLLADAGFEPEALALLGVNRNPYIGLGGPIRIHLDEKRSLDWTDWPGPHDIRLPANQTFELEIAPGTTNLLVIENRQAAEAICDHYPDTAVIWCHGQPPTPVLALINQAASQVACTIICPDADLGGIRIAARIHDHLPTTTPRKIVDIGANDHIIGEQFGPTTRKLITRYAHRSDSVGQLARSCLRRSYAIEQEAPTRAALRSLL